jgi:DNA-binding MarR family transcriptional regulator
VGKLVKARLLAKFPDPEDARAIKVTLTEKGSKLIQDMTPSLRAVNDRLFANMSRSDMTILTRLLRQIIVEGSRLVEADGASNK